MQHILLHICFGTFYKAIKYVVIVTLPVVTKRLVKIWIPSSIHHLSISLTVNLYGYLSTSNLNVSCLSWTVVHRETLYYSINMAFLKERKKLILLLVLLFFFCIVTTVNTVQDVASLQMFDFFYIIHHHCRFFYVSRTECTKRSACNNIRFFKICMNESKRHR